MSDERARLTVIHVVPTYLPALRYGGPILAVHGLARALAERGHAVHALTTVVDGPHDLPAGRRRLDGVEVHYLPVRGGRLGRRVYYAPALEAALDAIAGERRIVHTHAVFLWPPWAASRWAARRRIPQVLSPRGMLVPELIAARSAWPKRAWIAAIERGNLARSACVHFTSTRERSDFAALGLRARRTAVVPNGIEPPPPVPGAARDRRRVLYLGRINWKKGLPLLIEALAQCPQLELDLVGNDEEGYTEPLLRQAAARGCAGRVHVLGPRYGAEKAALLARAGVLVLPSRSENFGNSVLEAMAYGVPVVVCEGVGAAELVERHAAGLVVPYDSTALAGALERLSADPTTAAHMGERGRAAVAQHYTWSALAVQYEALYHELLESPA